METEVGRQPKGGEKSEDLLKEFCKGYVLMVKGTRCTFMYAGFFCGYPSPLAWEISVMQGQKQL